MGHEEVGRGVYIENDIYNLVRECAGVKLRDATDLTYLIGQRKGDALKVSLTALKDGAVCAQQNKDKAKPRIAIEGSLSSSSTAF